jgi:hypothetical protein
MGRPRKQPLLVVNDPRDLSKFRDDLTNDIHLGNDLGDNNNQEIANKIDVVIDGVDKTVTVAYIESRQFDNTSGRKISAGRVQYFNAQAWDNFRKNAAGLGINYVAIYQLGEGLKAEFDATVQVLLK